MTSVYKGLFRRNKKSTHSEFYLNRIVFYFKKYISIFSIEYLKNKFILNLNLKNHIEHPHKIELYLFISDTSPHPFKIFLKTIG